MCSRVVIKIVGLLKCLVWSLLNSAHQPSDKPTKKAAKGGDKSTIEFGGILLLWFSHCGVSASESRCYAGAFQEARGRLKTKINLIE